MNGNIPDKVLCPRCNSRIMRCNTMEYCPSCGHVEWQKESVHFMTCMEGTVFEILGDLSNKSMLVQIHPQRMYNSIDLTNGIHVRMRAKTKVVPICSVSPRGISLC